jgi:peptide subunit release factor RF-3
MATKTTKELLEEELLGKICDLLHDNPPNVVDDRSNNRSMGLAYIPDLVNALLLGLRQLEKEEKVQLLHSGLRQLEKDGKVQLLPPLEGDAMKIPPGDRPLCIQQGAGPPLAYVRVLCGWPDRPPSPTNTAR